ncbi:hypothetical protein B5G28_12750 [Faecalibacterium sp. An77]|uniref:hypothetical protein n=1 Tax=Faecalibacterium sp. An77 TaxID=1965655 RepID=UPI000B38B248|nr:hypothetical protein [Faecalibacterium sp. An77]OUN34407.1 hypothetical protein B5G28_12750 [Faecalibacterium sp. An77]
MNANETMKLPASCTLMTEEEMMYTDGGTAAETAVKAVIAVGGAAALLVGCIAARGILSIFGGVDSAIDSSVDAGKSFIGGALDAGKSFLNALMGL